ncbi:hypothetical protein BBJ28_00014270 [Nothophytophthora sp. Chile5]|nr:hypothetical protein BBJ28_00014270 [Nothophytophthora sp. Chile5]
MDDEDMRALAALQEVPQPFAAHVRQRRMAACPHCHEGFGSASLHIHMRRCRALYPSTGDDPDIAEQAPKPPKRKEVPSLADLYVKTQNRECRAGVEKLERALLASQRNVAQLESVREAEATIRARLSLQQHAAQRLERELDAAKAALAVAESENRKLRVQVDSNEPHQLRLEAKVVHSSDQTLREISVIVNYKKGFVNSWYALIWLDPSERHLPIEATDAARTTGARQTMLQRTSGLVRRTIVREEAQLALNRRVLTEVRRFRVGFRSEPTECGVLIRFRVQVQAVLDEMVYDVENCDHECELVRLRRQLATTESSLSESQERESELIQERQQAYDYALKVEQDGREIVSKLDEHLAVVVLELSKKEVYVVHCTSRLKDLEQAKEQLRLTSQLSKELASAQREIRELRRTNDIQYLLKGSSIVAKPSVESRIPPSRGAQALAVATPPPKESSTRETAFAKLPDKLLMNVFAFLDANSVFAISATDRALMGRVNAMFGMAAPVSSANGASKTAANPPLVSSPAKKQLKNRSLSFISTSEKDKLSKVDALVRSLKPDQIKLFHDMSTRVKTLEVRLNAHLAQVQTEKEDVAARLYGAENVRDFLMEKLKDLEDTLATSMTNTAKKDEQAALDREIIGFLDAKTQEYEATLKEYAHQNDGLRVEISHLQEEHASKTTIVQDMVELLTEEKKDLDVQLRSQRKVLVREVKVLRAQNQQLVTEKDHYFTQLKQLKRALQHLDELN